jgi:hypothetical protein
VWLLHVHKAMAACTRGGVNCSGSHLHMACGTLLVCMCNNPWKCVCQLPPLVPEQSLTAPVCQWTAEK